VVEAPKRKEADSEDEGEVARRRATRRGLAAERSSGDEESDFD
jgi:hypothetical protein